MNRTVDVNGNGRPNRHTLGWTLGVGIALLGFARPTLALNEACAACHGPRVAAVAASAHATLPCTACHEGAIEHGRDTSAATAVHFDLELCGGCHPNQFATYVYGDDFKTRYGGSPFEYAKLEDFIHYNDVIDGYGFTKEYNEERSHNLMLADHYAVTRGKYETCLQCKSTKATYYWDTGKAVTLRSDVYVKAGHMAVGITVPKGTTVRMSTARDAPYPYAHEARVLVTLPTGVTYASYAYPGAIQDRNWTWSAVYAITVDLLGESSPTRLSGNGCNHCHDPHAVARDAATGELAGWRIIRKSLVDAISRRGLNPYEVGSPRSFDGSKPLNIERGVALCGQCHSEYVCGNSPIDGIDRDYFPWARVSELEGIYATVFPGDASHPVKYVQDWIHGTGPLSSPFAPANGVFYSTPFPIQEALVKSQHPEAETYWGSRHYDNGAACFACHMPRVTKQGGGAFTSHWMASPLKYMAPEPVGAFAQAVGLVVDLDGIISPCGACHNGQLPRMKTKAEAIQDGVYANAKAVEQALVDALAAIKAAKDAQDAGQAVDSLLLAGAVEDHRAAHIRWENLIISENSMGFHDPAEVDAELKAALTFAGSARTKALGAVGGRKR